MKNTIKKHLTTRNAILLIIAVSIIATIYPKLKMIAVGVIIIINILMQKQKI